MIKDLILVKVPRFFAFLYRLISESFIYATAARFWRAAKKGLMESVVGRLASEHRDEGKKSAQSLLFRVIDGIGLGAVKLTRKAVGAMTFGSYSFAGTRILARLRGIYGFLDMEFFIGICLCFFFLCPGEMWHNVYGLVLSILLLVCEILMMAADKRKYVSLRCVGAAFFAFVISTAVSAATAGDRSDAFRVMVFYATAFIMAIVMAVDLTDMSKVKKVLGFIYGAVIATSLYAFYQRAVGVSFNILLTDVEANFDMPGRVFSTFENPNNYAEILILTIPLGIAFCTMIENKRTRLIASLLELLPFAALLMTYSRSGWVSFALSALIFVFLYNKKLLPAIILAGFFAAPLLPSSVLARISTIGSTQDSSNSYRLYIWEGALKMLGEDNTWFSGVGIGPASFRLVYLPVCVSIAAPASHAHMLYFEIWLEQGLVGILTYIVMLISAVRRSVMALKYAPKGIKMTLIAGVSALGGISFAAAAEYIWFYPRVMVIYFVVLGILYACINQSGREASADLK